MRPRRVLLVPMLLASCTAAPPRMRAEARDATGVTPVVDARAEADRSFFSSDRQMTAPL